MNDEEMMQNLTQEVYGFTSEFIMKGNSPFAIAASYVMIAMQIYRTILSEDEYNQMVDVISDSRSQVKTLNDIGRTLN